LECGATSRFEDFVHDHQPPHGPLTGDASEAKWNGYLITVGCLCGRCLSGVSAGVLGQNWDNRSPDVTSEPEHCYGGWDTLPPPSSCAGAIIGKITTKDG